MRILIEIVKSDNNHQNHSKDQSPQCLKIKAFKIGLKENVANSQKVLQKLLIDE